MDKSFLDEEGGKVNPSRGNAVGRGMDVFGEEPKGETRGQVMEGLPCRAGAPALTLGTACLWISECPEEAQTLESDRPEFQS